ncbi:Bax inhibitor-1/YccA family protein [Rhabdothermincola sediminis]|uniref:Bax inhibitor-1/YccA family protein n=1 Tax=Rhabdothermincola sediminis TaxID=2751370 RepID=UPI001AA027F9|nr:Bax inhibitor-1/YccA family protein [Rhabdothermincola sediminis]
MANPVLTPERWQRELTDDQPGWAAPRAATAAGYAAGGVREPMAPPMAGAPTMTVGGTLTATGVLFLCILLTGWVGWIQVTQTAVDRTLPDGTVVTDIVTDYPGWVFWPMIAAVVVAFVTVVKPHLARFLAPLYALGFGFSIGAISHMYDLQYDGIVVQAVGATLAALGAMFVLYATRIIKVTQRFVMVVVGATAGIFVLYLVTWIASIFGADIAFWRQPTALGIGISVVICIVAALNLAIDFAFIEQATKAGAPKYMEWYGAFGITVTLVWLYLEMLRLLALLRQD